MQTLAIQKPSIRKNDQVQVISGRERGKVGKVLSVNAKSGRIIIEKVNMVKRHTKPSQKQPQGGVVEKESSLHYSNVLLFCAKCNRGVRHGHKMTDAAAKKGARKAAGATAKQKKIRVCKRCNESLDVA